MPRKKKANDFSRVDLDKIETPEFRDYQLDLFRVPSDSDVMVLKSRQIGFTYAAAWCSLWLAISEGRNQIHISASRNQVAVMRRYIFMFAKKYMNVEMSGVQHATCLLQHDETVDFVFCSTNSATAQSYNGDLWVDEFAWIPNASKLLDTAAGMTANKKYRMVYITTPSTTSSYAFQVWKGLDEEGNAVEDRLHRLHFDIDTAIQRGCDWIDRDKILSRVGERFDYVYSNKIQLAMDYVLGILELKE